MKSQSETPSKFNRDTSWDNITLWKKNILSMFQCLSLQINMFPGFQVFVPHFYINHITSIIQYLQSSLSLAGQNVSRLLRFCVASLRVTSITQFLPYSICIKVKFMYLYLYLYSKCFHAFKFCVASLLVKHNFYHTVFAFK